MGTSRQGNQLSLPCHVWESLIVCFRWWILRRSYSNKRSTGSQMVSMHVFDPKYEFLYIQSFPTFHVGIYKNKSRFLGLWNVSTSYHSNRNSLICIFILMIVLPVSETNNILVSLSYLWQFMHWNLFLKRQIFFLSMSFTSVLLDLR